MTAYIHRVIFAISLSLLIACAGRAESVWPGWRGDGNGVYRGNDAPVRWDREHGVAWKTRLPGEGSSSPAVWNDRVFVTAAVENGLKRLVICVDAKSGEIAWQTPIDSEQTKTYPRTGHAAPTPVTDGERVYAFFDAPGLIVLDMAGKEVWRATFGPLTNSYNQASSPVICGDNILINVTHRGPSFLVALDRKTGAERWRTEKDKGHNYATPVLLEREGKTQIVLNGPRVVAYDAAGGKELWWCGGMMPAVNPSAIVVGGMVYATSGRDGPSMIIDPAGSGDVTNTHVKMHVPTGGPYVPSPSAYAGLFIVPGDDGRMTVFNAAGERVLRHRIRARFSSSPVVAGSHLYWVDEMAQTHVLDLSKLTATPPEVVLVGVNALEAEDSDVLASPAFAGGRVYIRTPKHLYAIVGGEAKLAAAPAVDLPDDFDQLKTLYIAEKKGEYDNTKLRLDMVEKFAAMKDPRVIEMMVEMIKIDVHWDITEAAIRVIGERGEPAVPTLVAMLDQAQPFYKTVAAEYLGQIRSPAAAARLIEAVQGDKYTKRQPQVRTACMAALAATAAAHGEVAVQAGPAVMAALEDGDPMVRYAAVTALGQMADVLGDAKPQAAEAVRKRLGDENVLVKEAAEQVAGYRLGEKKP